MITKAARQGSSPASPSPQRRPHSYCPRVKSNGGVYGQPFYSGDPGQGNRYRDYFNSHSRMVITIDTRTAPEYGVVRTFGQGDFQFQNFGTSNPSSSVGTAAGLNNALLSTAGGGYVAVEMVFIQFAGFTFGKSASAHSTPWNGFPRCMRGSDNPRFAATSAFKPAVIARTCSAIRMTGTSLASLSDQFEVSASS